MLSSQNAITKFASMFAWHFIPPQKNKIALFGVYRRWTMNYCTLEHVRFLYCYHF